MRTIFYNAAVYTGTLPLQEAFGVEDDVFFFTGTNAEARKQAADRFVDLQGAFTCAGFTDSHMHLLNYGQSLVIAPLHQHTGSLADMLHCLAKTSPGPGNWILGRGWNQDYFADERRMPNRWDLDKVSADRPVCAVRACGHALCVNSKALELLGITGETPRIEGGQIVMEDGRPNGVFLDNAMDLVYGAFPVPDRGSLKRMILAACADLNARGMQCAIHCIGDACLDMVLSSLEKALVAHPRENHRHGIVHCQITRPDQLEKIAQMGLHVYAQSIFLDYDIHMVRDRVGDRLADSSYSWKTLRNLGATVSNGSDCPVELPDVLGGIQCAVTRTDLNSSVPPYLSEESFTVQEALDSFTTGGAYASFQEHCKGRVQPGMLVDFVVLEKNPFEEAASSLGAISISETWLAGKKVFTKS